MLASLSADRCGSNARRTGRCYQCPSQCNGRVKPLGCHSCHNDPHRISCGREKLTETLECAAEEVGFAVTSTLVQFASCFQKNMEDSSPSQAVGVAADPFIPETQYAGCINDLLASLETCHHPTSHCEISIGIDGQGQLTSCMDVARFGKGSVAALVAWCTVWWCTVWWCVTPPPMYQFMLCAPTRIQAILHRNCSMRL